jgi:hypothetical protein
MSFVAQTMVFEFLGKNNNLQALEQDSYHFYVIGVEVCVDVLFFFGLLLSQKTIFIVMYRNNLYSYV